MINLLVQNYYEIKGTFSGIELLDEQLRVASKEKGCSIYEFCYQALGYKPVLDGSVVKYTAEQVCKLHHYLLLDDTESIQSIIPDYTKKDATKLCRLVGMNSSMRHNAFLKKLSEREQMIAKALYQYYLNLNTKCVSFAGALYDFRTAIMLLKQKRRCVPLGTITNDPGFTQAFVTLKLDKTVGDKFYVANCALYIQELDEDRWELIHKIVLEALLSGSGISTPSCINIATNEYMFLSISNPKAYLELLDYANYLGITYKELVSEFGLNVADQSKLYKEYGLVGVIASEKFFFIDAPASSKGCYTVHSCRLADFLVSKAMGVGADTVEDNNALERLGVF